MTKAVFITGASSGIGYAAAVRLAKNGYHVYAGVRNTEDFKRLESASKNLTPVYADVTKPEQIHAVYKTISATSPDLFHLINNAGVATPGPVETLSLKGLRELFDVNFFGLVETTQIFLPLLRKTKGRVVNLSSISGISSTPFLGAYSASKYAVEAMSDSLRWELAPAGVKVIILQPGPIATEIWNKGLAREDEFVASIPRERLEDYRSAIARFIKIAHASIAKALPVDTTNKAILLALENDNPPTRILVVGRTAKIQLAIARALPQKVLDKAIGKIVFGKSSKKCLENEARSV